MAQFDINPELYGFGPSQITFLLEGDVLTASCDEVFIVEYPGQEKFNHIIVPEEDHEEGNTIIFESGVIEKVKSLGTVDILECDMPRTEIMLAKIEHDRNFTNNEQDN